MGNKQQYSYKTITGKIDSRENTLKLTILKCTRGEEAREHSRDNNNKSQLKVKAQIKRLSNTEL